MASWLSLLLTLTTILLHLSLTRSALLFKEDRACDPLRQNIFPYTGFRLTRQYTYSLIPPFKHYVRLSHCIQGRVNYDAYSAVDRNSGFVWGVNMCGFVVTGGGGGYIYRGRELMASHREKVQRKARMKTLTSSKKRRIANLSAFFQTINLVLAQNNGTATEFISESLGKQQEQQNIPQWCYRAVRRKKYALRDISVFTAGTFVGGLFLCPQAPVKCTNANAVPVLPLYADDFAAQWFEIEAITKSNPVYDSKRRRRRREVGRDSQSHDFDLQTIGTGLTMPKSKNLAIRLGRFVARKRHFIQRIPYFYTKVKHSRLDLRYTPSGGVWPEWAYGLDVNEAYVYTRKELFKINRALSAASNIIVRYMSISAFRLPWERSVLDSIDTDGEKYGKVPISQPESNEFQPPTRANEILEWLERLGISRKKMKKLLVELQQPFEN